VWNDLKKGLYGMLSAMAARKPSGRKNRLMKKTKQNSPTPAWIIVRTNRRVRRNPKQREWRRTDVNVG
jgi:large subunit ribosomal protein L39e